MGSVYARGGQLWLDYRDINGERRRQPTGCGVEAHDDAEELLRRIEMRIEAERRALKAAGVAPAKPLTVRTYALGWFDRRKLRIRTHADERTRIEKHALPRIGSMLIADVKPRDIRDVIVALQDGSKLAPRSILHVYGSLHVMFRDAKFDEVVATNPCELPVGILPRKEDRDPEWRPTAIFSRQEVETLISDERILLDRRVVYALKGLAGLRHGEVAGLKWTHYDPTAEPLGRLTIANSYKRKGTKTGVTRAVPVHATLASVLAAWKLSGWQATFGRRPEADDFIVPSRRFDVRAAEEAAHAFRRDLGLVELRHRRGHDLRRTFISLALADGARRDILETVSHGPRGDIMSMYTTLPWPAVCAEVAKLRVELRRGEVVKMPKRARVVSGATDTVWTQPMQTTEDVKGIGRPQRDLNPRR